MIRLSVFLLLLLSSYLSFAMTLYVDDAKTAVLYNLPKANADIVEQLTLNEPVKLLKTNLENGYSLIETAKKSQGWIKTQYLAEQPLQNRMGFFSRLLHRALSNDKNKVALGAVQNSTHKALLAQSETLKQQVITLNQAVLKLQKQQHGRWFWLMLGVLIALAGVVVGFMFSKKRRSRGYY